MSYFVLARKYRPAGFASVMGQEQVTKTLQNGIKRGKIAHAFLFTGPRGVGKTSIARILSKALNCEKGPTPEPCLKCTNCVEISAGNSLSVREIDGASHNSVDNVRELIDSFRSLPPPGSRYKIYIIDEVHMLSTAAFNALLKSLEEPPQHAIFILATTEAHKIPDTVISRCQRHDLRALRAQDVSRCLSEIAEKEKIQIDDEALQMLSRLADGSMRDAQSLLDRVHSYCEGNITGAAVSQLLGAAEKRVLFELSRAVFSRDAGAVLETLERAFSTGLDPSLFLRDMAAHWRELLLAKFGSTQQLESFGISADALVELKRQAESVGSADLQDLVQLAQEGADHALRSSHPRYALEALMVRLATREKVADMAQLIARIESGVSVRPTAPQSSAEVPARTVVKAAAPSPAAPLKAKSVPQPVSEDVAAPGLAGHSKLDWGDFVAHVADTVSKMFAEQLKRLAVERFEPGVLRASGPDFIVKGLKDKEGVKKLRECLDTFAKARDWKVSLEASAERSAAVDDAASGGVRTGAKGQDLSEHPRIKSLQKVFPGSKIENIKVTD